MHRHVRYEGSDSTALILQAESTTWKIIELGLRVSRALSTKDTTAEERRSCQQARTWGEFSYTAPHSSYRATPVPVAIFCVDVFSRTLYSNQRILKIS